MRYFLSAFFILLVSLAVSAAVQAAESEKAETAAAAAHKYILITGVSSCDRGTGSSSDLAGPIEDALCLKDRLLKSGFSESDISLLVCEDESFDLLTDEGSEERRPTRAHIAGEIDRILDTAESGDFILFAFFGCGAHWGETDYFCPLDFDPASTETAAETGISITELVSRLGKSPASFRLMIIDPNRTDPFALPSENRLGKVTGNLNGAFLFQSSRAGESSYSGDESECSIFTESLAGGLAGAADLNKDARITLFELCKYTIFQTKSKTQNKQTPFLLRSGADSADFTIYTDSAARDAAEAFTAYADLLQQKKPREALIQIQKALALKPENEEYQKAESDLRGSLINSMMKSAEMEYSRKNYENVLKIMDEVLKIDPNNVNAFTARSTVGIEMIPEFAAVPIPAEEAPSRLQEVTPDQSLDRIVKSAPVVVLDLTAVWCGPCQMLRPYLERMAVVFQGPNTAFYSVDCDKNEELVSAIGAGAIPDVRIFLNGRPYDGLAGFDPLRLYQKIQNAVKSAER